MLCLTYRVHYTNRIDIASSDQRTTDMMRYENYPILTDK